MYKLLIGLLFISVNYSIQVDYAIIGVIPDFIGYILIGQALRELEDEATYFVAARGPVKIMTLVSIFMYIIDLTGIVRYGFLSEVIDSLKGVLYMALGFACLIMFVYITYLITCGVQEMEGEYNQDMNGDGLMLTWKWMVGVKATYYCLSLILPYVLYLTEIFTVALMLTVVLYLLHFYKSARSY